MLPKKNIPEHTLRFINPSHAHLDLPKIHAPCCRVSHLSGAGEHMNQILKGLEDDSSAHCYAQIPCLLYNLIKPCKSKSSVFATSISCLTCTLYVHLSGVNDKP
jgi:hypothetical protein